MNSFRLGGPPNGRAAQSNLFNLSFCLKSLNISVKTTRFTLEVEVPHLPKLPQVTCSYCLMCSIVGLSCVVIQLHNKMSCSDSVKGCFSFLLCFALQDSFRSAGAAAATPPFPTHLLLFSWNVRSACEGSSRLSRGIRWRPRRRFCSC